MTFLSYEQRKKSIVDLTFLILVFSVLYFIIRYAAPLFLPFIIGLTFACALKTPVRCLRRRSKFGRLFAAPLLVSVALALIFLALYGALYTLTHEFRRLYEVLPALAENLPSQLNGIGDGLFSAARVMKPEISAFLVKSLENAAKSITEYAGTLAVRLLGAAGSFAAKLPDLLVFAVATIAACYLCTSYFDQICSALKKLMPKKIVEFATSNSARITSGLLKMVKGYFFLTSLTFIELLVGFSLIGIPYAFSLSLLICILDLLPVIGISTVFVPWSVFAFISGDFKLGISLLLLLILLMCVRQLIEPKIIGSQIGLHPLATLVSVYIGLKVGGILGMIMLPFFIIIATKMYESEIHERQIKTGKARRFKSFDM